MQLDINSKALGKFTRTLEKMHKSALPVAVRQTLNKTALEVKQKTMPAEAAATFESRKPNFFKANSKVDFASGFAISSMQATIGFLSDKLAGSTNYAVKDLEQQEHGGTIQGKTFIPMDPARGGSSAKPVRPSNRITKIDNLVDARKARGKNPGQRFIKSVIHAGRGGHVLAAHKGKRIIWRVNSLRRVKGEWKLKLTPLHVLNPEKKVRVKATGFMRDASLKSAAGMNARFIEEARKQVERLRK